MQALNSEGKNSLEPFSKELKIVLLYSIKTVVSHLKLSASLARSWPLDYVDAIRAA